MNGTAIDILSWKSALMFFFSILFNFLVIYFNSHLFPDRIFIDILLYLETLIGVKNIAMKSTLVVKLRKIIKEINLNMHILENNREIKTNRMAMRLREQCSCRSFQFLIRWPESPHWENRLKENIWNKCQNSEHLGANYNWQMKQQVQMSWGNRVLVSSKQ